jgi:ketosteroid isomerase-like protein
MSTPDVAAIERVLVEYCTRLDAGDLDGVAELLAAAVVVSSRAPEVERRGGEIRRMYDDVVLYADGTPRTQHRLANVVVDVVGDTARARSSFAVLQLIDGRRIDTVLAGEYHDELARTSDGWELRHRTIVPTLIGDLSHHMRGVSAPPGAP